MSYQLQPSCALGTCVPEIEARAPESISCTSALALPKARTNSCSMYSRWSAQGAKLPCFCASAVVIGTTAFQSWNEVLQNEFSASRLGYSRLSHSRKPASPTGAQLTSKASP